MIAILPHPDGAILPVLAQPGSKRSGILGERGGLLRIAVTAVPEKGKANEAIQAVLADALDCRAGKIALMSGASSRQKRFLIAGITPDGLRDRLACLVPGIALEPSPAAVANPKSKRAGTR